MRCHGTRLMKHSFEDHVLMQVSSLFLRVATIKTWIFLGRSFLKFVFYFHADITILL